jgi:hypothetical protein
MSIFLYTPPNIISSSINNSNPFPNVPEKNSSDVLSSRDKYMINNPINSRNSSITQASNYGL